MKLSLRYRVDKKIRAAVMWVMRSLTPRTPAQQLDLRRQHIKKILLVRSSFRMGGSILGTPAIFMFRKSFPGARIDFVGSAISKALFDGLPIDHYYEAERHFPKVCWSYIALLRQIRAVGYDLAVDVSGSSAALGSFIVGFSGARFRAGLRGKWDHWFNARFARPTDKNKYGSLPELLRSMGLEEKHTLPTLTLSANEKKAGKTRLTRVVGCADSLVIGIFVGGRKTRGKRWDSGKFVELAGNLRRRGAEVVIFLGPEEHDWIGYFQHVLGWRAAVVFEPDPRIFAAMVANCTLFIACDSGPMHLACALRVRTIAIFLQDNFKRWGPPPRVARIVYGPHGVTVQDVLEAVLLEVSSVSEKTTPGSVGK